MNLQNINPYGQVRTLENGTIPENTDEIMQEMIRMYVKGEINDDDDDETRNNQIAYFRAMLAERGHDDEFVARMKEQYNPLIFQQNERKEIIDDEEECKILDEHCKLKRKDN